MPAASRWATMSISRASRAARPALPAQIWRTFSMRLPSWPRAASAASSCRRISTRRSSKVVMGPEKKSRVVSERARRLTAYHESGHAIASFFLKNADPCTISRSSPRRRPAASLGTARPRTPRTSTSRGEMFDSIVSALGGRIAEQPSSRIFPPVRPVTSSRRRTSPATWS